MSSSLESRLFAPHASRPSVALRCAIPNDDGCPGGSLSGRRTPLLCWPVRAHRRDRQTDGVPKIRRKYTKTNPTFCGVVSVFWQFPFFLRADRVIGGLPPPFTLFHGRQKNNTCRSRVERSNCSMPERTRLGWRILDWERHATMTR